MNALKKKNGICHQLLFEIHDKIIIKNINNFFFSFSFSQFLYTSPFPHLPLSYHFKLKKNLNVYLSQSFISHKHLQTFLRSSIQSYISSLLLYCHVKTSPFPHLPLLYHFKLKKTSKCLSFLVIHISETSPNLSQKQYSILYIILITILSCQNL